MLTSSEISIDYDLEIIFETNNFCKDCKIKVHSFECAWMENCPLLKIQKGCPLQFTWNGNEECFRKHEKKIYTALSNGEISWKRQDKKSPYPLHIRFKSKFVPFKEELVFSPNVEEPSIDEYRLKVRSELCEWFAILNAIENSQWFIIFDNGRAKEKKNRGHVMEKIKSDFSKFIDKIIELNDQNEKISIELVQNALCNALDSFVVAHENYFSKLKTSYMTDGTWNLAKLINQQVHICRVHWSLSLYENVLSLLDELDLIITETLRKASVNPPEWFSYLKNVAFGEFCPFLRVFMYVDCVTETLDLITMRTFVLAQQILCSFFAYNFRLKSLSYTITEDEKFQQLASNFASFIFRYVLQCMNRISDDICILKISASDIFHEIWTVMLTIDGFDLCDMLCALDSVDSGVIYFGQLLYHRCLSLSSIFKQISSNEFNKNAIIKWLDFILNDSSSENLLTPNVIEFCKALANEDPSRFNEYYKDALLDAFRVFEKFHWTRHADLTRHLLIEFFKHSKENEKIYEFMSRLISDIFKDFRESRLLLECCHLLLSNYSSHVTTNPELFFDCLLIISTNESTPSTELFNEFISKIKCCDTKIHRYNFATSKTVFPFKIINVWPNFSEAVINTSIKLEATIEDILPFSLSTCKIKFFFKKITKSTLDAGFHPIFSSSQGSSEPMFRFACVSKGLISKELDLISYLSSSIDKCGDLLVFSTEDDESVFQPGSNNFALYGKTSHMGSYMLNHIEVDVNASIIFFLHYQQEIETNPSLENIYCSVGVRLPSVFPLSTDKNLYSGVAQCLCFRVRAGTLPIASESKLHVSAFGSSNVMEFLNEDNSWRNEAEVSIKALASEESHVVEIFCCLPIDRMNYSADQALKVQHKILIMWQEQTWTLPLNFSPIMSLKTMTSILEDRVLFEMDIQRSDGQSDLIIQPQKAEILQYNSVIKPPVEAKLLNPVLDPIVEGSSSRFIWQIPITNIDKTINIKHHLKLLYSVQMSTTKSIKNNIIPKCAFEREYFFDEDLTFCIHKAEYEVCAQVLSEHPQTTMCRTESQCDLLISLRSLANRPEHIIVVVEADPEYWTSIEKHKIVQIKESGIGQTSFSIIPKQIGFLSYPSIYIHKYNGENNDKESLNETELFGERLTSFHRNHGKQIHVLSQQIPSEDAVSSTSTGSSQKTSLKTSAKQKLQKLFE